jgi:hypothetical protein
MQSGSVLPETKQEKANTNVFPPIDGLNLRPDGDRGDGTGSGAIHGVPCVHRVSIKKRVRKCEGACVVRARVLFSPRSRPVHVAGLAPSPTVARLGQIPHRGERCSDMSWPSLTDSPHESPGWRSTASTGEPSGTQASPCV